MLTNNLATSKLHCPITLLSLSCHCFLDQLCYVVSDGREHSPKDSGPGHPLIRSLSAASKPAELQAFGLGREAHQIHKVRLQAGPADQRAIYIGVSHELGHIGRLDAAAILDPHGLGRGFVV